LLALAAAPLAYYGDAIFAACAFFRAARRVAEPFRLHAPVSNLKPIRGAIRMRTRNFASFCCQELSDYELVSCVSDSRRPGVAGD